MSQITPDPNETDHLTDDALIARLNTMIVQSLAKAANDPAELAAIAAVAAWIYEV